MANADEIVKRVIRILVASTIGAVLGMWAFAVPGMIAMLVALWSSPSWSMAPIFITTIGIFQSVQGTTCGVATGLIVGAIKRPVPAAVAGGLAGLVTNLALYSRANSGVPFTAFLGLVGVVLTGIVVARMMILIWPSEARQSMSRRARNIAIGCLAVLALPLVIYLVHGLLVVSQSNVAQLNWQQKGINNYSVKSSYVAFGSAVGKGETLLVRNGQIAAIQGGHPPYAPLEQYRMATVEGMYDYIRSIAFVPNYWVMVTYHPDYGYPKEIRANCVTVGECEYVLRVEEFQIGGDLQ